jgi:hypothetical protein
MPREVLTSAVAEFMAIDHTEHSPSTTRSVRISPRSSSFQPHYSGNEKTSSLKIVINTAS